jgi:hypothetical protein
MKYTITKETTTVRTYETEADTLEQAMDTARGGGARLVETTEQETWRSKENKMQHLLDSVKSAVRSAPTALHKVAACDAVEGEDVKVLAPRGSMARDAEKHGS